MSAVSRGMSMTRAATPEEVAEKLSRIRRFKCFLGGVVSGVITLLFSTFWWLNSEDIRDNPQYYFASFSMGSLAFPIAFAVLKGPGKYLEIRLKPEELPTTLLYSLSLLALWFFILVDKNYAMICLLTLLQLFSIGWLTAATIPGCRSCIAGVFKLGRIVFKCVYACCARFARSLG
jgi:hypothetical protein